MRAVASLLAEARALGMLRGLAFDGLAMALTFAALAGFYVSTPGAVASPAPADTATVNVSATGGGR